ncbi:MAG: hypothetical protein ABR598_08105 [Candidatus Dormibacteria bacterium]
MISRVLAGLVAGSALIGFASMASATPPPPPPDYSTRVTTGNAIVPGTTDIGNHCDDCVTQIALPFPVPFYGTPQSTVQASSNGNIQFTTAALANASYSPNAACLPDGSFTNPVFAYYMDLRTDATGQGIFTATTGTTPNRSFVIEWRAGYYRNPSLLANFEVILHESSPTITVIYGATADSGLTAASGVQNGTGPQITKYSCRAATLTAGTRVDYTVPETLTVTKSGNGTGTVNSSPTGIACGATCTHDYASDTVVTLTATADPQMTFVGWSGDCTGTGSCQVTMTQARTVNAQFIRAPKSLAVTKTGAGTGTVTSSPAGINCGTSCTASFADGTVVTLTATADAHMSFTGWSGACTGTGTCQVTMGSNQQVSAAFAVVPTPALPKAGVPAAPSQGAGWSLPALVALALAMGTAVGLRRAAR